MPHLCLLLLNNSHILHVILHMYISFILSRIHFYIYQITYYIKNKPCPDLKSNVTHDFPLK